MDESRDVDGAKRKLGVEDDRAQLLEWQLHIVEGMNHLSGQIQALELIVLALAMHGPDKNDFKSSWQKILANVGDALSEIHPQNAHAAQKLLGRFSAGLDGRFDPKGSGH